MKPSDRRLIPSADVGRDAIERALRARGFRLVSDWPRAHLALRAFLWRAGAGAQVLIEENHVLGVRCVTLRGDVPPDLDALFDAVPRDALLTKATRPVPIGLEGLPALRSLCLLEQDAPSEPVRSLVARALGDPDILVRRLALDMVYLAFTPAHCRSFVEQARAHESDPRLRALCDRIVASLE
jgi:hypothetical protein